MKIAIVCTYYPFPPSVGGVETIVRGVATELAKRGYEIHIITTPLDVTTQKPVTSLDIEEREEVIIHKLKPSKIKIGYARILQGLKEEIARIKPDIVHAHNLHPHLFQLAKWKRNFTYKLIAELHHPAMELDFLVQKIMFPFATIALKHVSIEVDAFITHTQIERSWLVNRGIKNHKIHIVRLPGIAPKLLEIPPVNNPTYDIIYIGRIVRRKGLHILIKALHKIREKINEIKATVAGPADPVYLKDLMEMVLRFGLRHAIEFKGLVSEDQKYKLLRHHKIFVLPSIKDYTPNVILEAQALGTPVVATKVGAIHELLIDKHTGILVDPNNPKNLAKTIINLLHNEDLRIIMSIKAREYAKNFTIDKTINKLEEIYKFIVIN